MIHLPDRELAHRVVSDRRNLAHQSFPLDFLVENLDVLYRVPDEPLMSSCELVCRVHKPLELFELVEFSDCKGKTKRIDWIARNLGKQLYCLAFGFETLLVHGSFGLEDVFKLIGGLGRRMHRPKPDEAYVNAKTSLAHSVLHTSHEF